MLAGPASRIVEEQGQQEIEKLLDCLREQFED